MSLLSMFRRAQPADGANEALEALATGIGPDALDGLIEAPALRRDRSSVPGDGGPEDVIAQKLVHFWLQNRNQTLVPLTLNARRLSPEQTEVLAGGLAALLTLGRPQQEASGAVPRMDEWLRGIGGDDALLRDMSNMIAAPPALGPLLERAISLSLTVYLYVGALLMVDDRFPATSALLDLLAARLELSSATIRSATRRYRR